MFVSRATTKRAATLLLLLPYSLKCDDVMMTDDEYVYE